MELFVYSIDYFPPEYIHSALKRNNFIFIIFTEMKFGDIIQVLKSTIQYH